MRAFVAGFLLELRIVRSSPDALMPLFTAPLFAIIFLAIVRQSGRDDLTPDALMAPVLMTLLWVALQHAGTVMAGDRWQALLEPMVAAPSSLASFLLGRIMLLMCFGLLSFVEVWIVAKLVFGVSIPLEHPFELFVTLAVTAAAVVGSLLGGRLAGRIPPAALRRGFGFFIIAMAILVLFKELS